MALSEIKLKDSTRSSAFVYCFFCFDLQQQQCVGVIECELRSPALRSSLIATFFFSYPVLIVIVQSLTDYVG